MISSVLLMLWKTFAISFEMKINYVICFETIILICWMWTRTRQQQTSMTLCSVMDLFHWSLARLESLSQLQRLLTTYLQINLQSYTIISYREYCWLIYPITILYFVWIIRSKRKLWQLLFPAGISVKEIKTNSCKQWLMLTGVIYFWLRILKQHLLFFYRKLIKIHALCFPLETISKRYNTRKPWLSQVLRDSIKKKNKLYIKSIKHKCLHNETVYKNYRNHLKKLLKVAEKKYYSDLISKYKSD